MDTKSPFRFSLRTMLLAVVAVSVGTAAMVSASEWWQAIAATIAIVMLIAAILLVAYRSGRSRAYWSGFAVSSGMYLFLMHIGQDQMLPGMLVNRLADVIHKAPNGSYSSPINYYPVPAPAAPAAPAPTLYVPQGVAQPFAVVPAPATTENVSSEPKGETEPVGNCQTSVLTDENIVIDDSAQTPSSVAYSSAGNAPAYISTSGVMNYDDLNARRQRCVAIGHFLSSMIFGMVGGSFAVWLHATRACPVKNTCESTVTENVNP